MEEWEIEQAYLYRYQWVTTEHTPTTNTLTAKSVAGGLVTTAFQVNDVDPCE